MFSRAFRGGVLTMLLGELLCRCPLRLGVLCMI